MQIVERTALSVGEYADTVRNRGRGLFQDKELRDRVFRLLQQDHVSPFKPRRSTVSGQVLHPEYVTDYVGTLEIGFGNTQYQTYWGKLYAIDMSGGYR